MSLRPWLVPAIFGLCAPLAACDPEAFDALVGGEGQRDSAVEMQPDSGRMPAGDAGTSKPPRAGGDGPPIMPPRDGAVDGGSTARPDDGGGNESDGDVTPPDDGGPTGCPRATDPAAVQVTATDLGDVTVAGFDQPTSGPSVQVGDRLLWVFGGPPMATWSTPREPGDSPPELVGPQPYVPVLPQEAVTVGTPFVGSGVRWGDHEALLFTASAFGLAWGEVGLARIVHDQPQAEVVHVAGEMFPHHRIMETPTPWTPAFHTGAILLYEPDGHYVYVYACNANPNEPSERDGGEHERPCRVARAPHAHAQHGASYTYWNGESWVGEVREAAVVMDHMAGSISVSFNEYLQRFVAVGSGRNNNVRLLWSERPEGPWQELGTFDTIQATGGFLVTYAAIEHPALRDPCHRALYVTYVLPLAMTDPQGMVSDVWSTRMVRVDLD